MNPESTRRSVHPGANTALRRGRPRSASGTTGLRRGVRSLGWALPHVLSWTLILGLGSCGDSSHAKDVRAKFSSAFQSLSDYTFEAKDQVADKLSELAEASADEIERLETLIQEKGPEAKAALAKKLESLKERRGELVEQLERAKDASADSWDAVSGKLESAAKGLNEAYQDATSDK